MRVWRKPDPLEWKRRIIQMDMKFYEYLIVLEVVEYIDFFVQFQSSCHGIKSYPILIRIV